MMDIWMYRAVILLTVAAIMVVINLLTPRWSRVGEVAIFICGICFALATCVIIARLMILTGLYG